MDKISDERIKIMYRFYLKGFEKTGDGYIWVPYGHGYWVNSYCVPDITNFIKRHAV